MDSDRLDRIEDALGELREMTYEIISTMGSLLDALTEDDEEHGFDLDGNELPGERDQAQPLG